MNPVSTTYSEAFKTVKKYSLLEKLQLLTLLVFTCTLTLDMRTNSLLLIICLLTLIPSFQLSRLKAYRLPVIIYTAGFVMAVIALLYSSNRHEGGLVLERQASLLGLPLLMFSCFKMDQVKFHILVKVFFISVVAISCYLLNISAHNFLSSHLTLKEWFTKDNLNHAFSKPISMHATYLSLYVAMAIFTGFYWLLLNDAWWVKLLVFLCQLALFVPLAMLSSRVVVATVFVVLFAVYPFFIRKIKHTLILLAGGVLLLIAFFFVIEESSFITERFTGKMDAEIKMTPFLKADSTYNPVYGGEMRADRWYCAVELIKEKPLIGYGTGSEKDVLMGKFEKYNLQNAAINKYDSHNQYLAYAIKGGIPALLVFLTSIVFAVYVAIRNRSFIYLSFILLFAVTCITENVLESNKGIFFFAFFNTLFCYFCLWQAKESEPSREKSK